MQGEHILIMTETEIHQAGRKNFSGNRPIHGRVEAVVEEELRLRMFRIVAGGDLFKVLPAYLIVPRTFDFG